MLKHVASKKCFIQQTIFRKFIFDIIQHFGGSLGEKIQKNILIRHTQSIEKNSFENHSQKPRHCASAVLSFGNV